MGAISESFNGGRQKIDGNAFGLGIGDFLGHGGHFRSAAAIDNTHFSQAKSSQ